MRVLDLQKNQQVENMGHEFSYSIKPSAFLCDRNWLRFVTVVQFEGIS